MVRFCALLLASLLLTLAGPTEARADGIYFEESLGTSSVGSDLGDIYNGSLFAKVSIGAHVDNLSAAAFFAADVLEARGGQQHPGTASLLRYGAEARYFIPMRNKVHLYMRGGLSSDHLTDSSLGPMRGRGIEYGTGAMFTTKVRALGFLFWPAFFAGIGPKVSLSLWSDLGGHFARLRDDRLRTLDVRTSTWSVGFTLGGDF